MKDATQESQLSFLGQSLAHRGHADTCFTGIRCCRASVTATPPSCRDSRASQTRGYTRPSDLDDTLTGDAFISLDTSFRIGGTAPVSKYRTANRTSAFT